MSAAPESGARAWPDRLAFLLLLGLVVNLAWLGGQASWRLQVPAVEIPSIYRGGEGPAGSVTSVSVPSISLGELDLFGRQESGEVVPQAISRKAPETRLRLILHGVMVARQPENSGAIVAEGSGEAGFYRVGDSLPGGATLVEVESDRVLIRRAGQIESLSFPEAGEDTGLDVAAESQPPPANVEEFAEVAQKRLSEAPIQALQSVGLRPREDGAGYVFDGSNPMLSAMNLKEGDAIVSINGFALGDPEQDQAMIQQWQQADELTIEVDRDGTRFTVTYPLPGR